jgi:hypothetical protein
MRKIILLLICGGFIASLTAQMNIDKHVNFTGKEFLALNIQIADSITIHTWNKEEVFVKASVNLNDNLDNEAYLTSFEETGKTLLVHAKLKENYFRGRPDCCIRSMITWDLYIPENTPFSVETINGNITIDGLTTEIRAKSISGFIDMEFSPDQKADLKLSTISGTLYSDLNLQPEQKNNSIPSVITQKLNNGGALVNLETISGNIYFRKTN